MSNWYVFYVKTGSEKIVCDFLNKLLNREESVAFIPQVELIFKNSKLIHKKLIPMFPGYVFTDSTVNERTFVTQVHKFVRFSNCIFKLLGNESMDYIKLTEDEKSFLLSFRKGCCRRTLSEFLQLSVQNLK